MGEGDERMGWCKLIIRVPNVDRWAIGYFIEDVQGDVKINPNSKGGKGGLGII